MKKITLKKFTAIFLISAALMHICHAEQTKEQRKSYYNYSLEPSKQQTNNETDEQKKIFDLVRKSLLGMMEPVEIFKGPGRIKGVLVKHPNREDNQFAVWVVDNEYVLLGDISDINGKAVSRVAYLDLIMSQAITQEALTELQGLSLNKGKRKLYVFADPNCNFCNKVYKMIHKTGLKQFTQEDLQIIWVPVAILNKDTSTRKAIAILKDGLPALKENETNFKASGGGIKGHEPSLNMPEALAVQRNTKTLKKFDEGRGAMTPTIVWTDKSGTQHVQVGTPASLDNFFD